jgi:hypothetical protein
MAGGTRKDIPYQAPKPASEGTDITVLGKRIPPWVWLGLASLGVILIARKDK